MEKIDKILFGDNQFFGINHMSQEKAQQLSQKFHNINNIYEVYNIAIEAGVDSIMLNSNQRALEICDYFRKNNSKYAHIHWYPSIPYPHKYANLVAEKGILPAINEVLFSNTSFKDSLSIIGKGSSAILFKDAIKMMQMLIDVEAKIFKGLDVKVLFLQNIITDLILGYGVKEIFIEYCDYISNKYDCLPGFITLNLPHLVNRLSMWGIKNVVICSAINKIGYLMSPNIDAYEEVLNKISSNEYQIVAMSIFASGAIHPEEAVQYVLKQKINSIVFGASSRDHINETVLLINKYFNSY